MSGPAHRITLALALLGVGAVAAPAQTTVTLNSTSQITDTTIRGGDYANTNHEGQPLVTKVHDNSDYVRRALVKFDTANTIPSGANIISAKMTLTLRASKDESRTLGAYRVKESFLGDDATWVVRRSSTTWANYGGSLGERVATATVGTSAGTKVTFDLTTLVGQVVRGDFGSRYTRVALLDLGTTTSGKSYKEFYSAEESDASRRPTLVVTYGSSTSTSTSTSSTVLKVLHWNTHHGVGTDGKYDLNRIASWIAKINPDVVSLNEVEKNSSYWGNEDQPAKYKSLLESKTGKKWYYVFAQRYGNWSSNGQGNLLLSRIPFDRTARYALSYGRSVAAGTVTVNGREVNVFSTHFDADSSSRRVTQANELKNWASSFAEQRIIGGDFNDSPGGYCHDEMTETYIDAWALAKSTGKAVAYSGNESGNTRNGRIDYIFHSKGATKLALQRAQVYDTRDSNGYMPSDHRPLMVTYGVN